MKRNKVYTRLVYDADGRLVEEESHEWAGPWMLAAETQDLDTGGDAPADPAPAPDAGGDAPIVSPADDEGGEAEGDGILDTLDFEDSDEEPTPKAAKTEPKVEPDPAAKVEPKPDEKPPAAAADAPKPAAPVTEPKPVEPTPAPVATAPKKTPDELRAEVQKSIAEKFFFTDEEKEKLQTDPASVLPDLAARVYVGTYEAVMYAIAQQLPGLIQHVSRSTVNEEQGRTAFFEKFPDLNKPEYAPILEQLGSQFRRLNPNATREEAIQKIGSMATAFFGLTPTAPAPASPGSGAAPAQVPVTRPKLPAVPAGARVGAGAVDVKPTGGEDPILGTLDFEMPDS